MYGKTVDQAILKMFKNIFLKTRNLYKQAGKSLTIDCCGIRLQSTDKQPAAADKMYK